MQMKAAERRPLRQLGLRGVPRLRPLHALDDQLTAEDVAMPEHLEAASASSRSSPSRV